MSGLKQMLFQQMTPSTRLQEMQKQNQDIVLVTRIKKTRKSKSPSKLARKTFKSPRKSKSPNAKQQELEWVVSFVCIHYSVALVYPKPGLFPTRNPIRGFLIPLVLRSSINFFMKIA